MALKYINAYYTGAIDNKIGPLMKSAYAKFQMDFGLVVDRIWGPASDTKLRELVKELQTLLDIKADGLFGPATLEAVKAFQRKSGLVVDGIAGVKTWAKLRGSGLSWENIRHFKRSEFKCGCKGLCNGYPAEPDLRLVKLLDDLRAYFGVPITITSGVRCKEYNDALPGSSKTSKHLEGKAADIYVPGVSKEKVKAKAYELGAAYSYYGTANMGSAVHINI